MVRGREKEGIQRDRGYGDNERVLHVHQGDARVAEVQVY